MVARDGEYCALCGKSTVRLEIDHIPTSTDEPEMYHLLCRSCNLKLRKVPVGKHSQIIRNAIIVRKSVCERESERERIIEHETERRSGSAEMQVNALAEKHWRDWLYEKLEKEGSITKKEAINGGAFIAGCSPITISRYLDKLLSDAGGLWEEKNGIGLKVIKKKFNLKGGRIAKNDKSQNAEF